MVKQGLSEWIRVPVIIARGSKPGPVIGITAVVHGNELNGVPCIHKVISDIDVSSLKGTLVAVPCVNVPGYLRFRREFSDGKDLNRYFPGTATGTSASIFNYNFFNKIIKQFNYLIDLHTASFGRVNSYYVRADMNDPVSAIFAKLQQPQVILHNSGQDGNQCE
jgi:predicted deacylase